MDSNTSSLSWPSAEHFDRDEEGQAIHGFLENQANLETHYVPTPTTYQLPLYTNSHYIDIIGSNTSSLSWPSAEHFNWDEEGQAFHGFLENQANLETWNLDSLGGLYSPANFNSLDNQANVANEVNLSNYGNPGDYSNLGGYSNLGDYGNPGNDGNPDGSVDPVWIFNTNLNPYDDSRATTPIPRIEVPNIHTATSTRKTRCEKQMQLTLTLGPLPRHIEYLRLEPKLLAHRKQLASVVERQALKSKALCMDIKVVCAKALKTPEGRQRALRRAAGTEETPCRREGVEVKNLAKDDPTHPANGGEVVICKPCREREKTRYSRKKQLSTAEVAFFEDNDRRVIVVSEKEHKKLRDVEGGEAQKQAEFNIRLMCYCRHQEGKEREGYQIILTFFLGDQLIAQHISEDTIIVTDDHKKDEG